VADPSLSSLGDARVSALGPLPAGRQRPLRGNLILRLLCCCNLRIHRRRKSSREGLFSVWPGCSHVRVFARHRRVKGATSTRLPESRAAARSIPLLHPL